MHRIAILALAAALAACSPDPATDYAQARALIAAGPAHAARALPLLERAARAGHPAAAWRLGLWLRQDAASRDAGAARGWLEQAAKAGHARAQFALGQMLMEEETGPAGFPARQWLEKAAEQELGEAHLALALAAREGRFGLTPEDGQRHWLEAQHALSHPRPRTED